MDGCERQSYAEIPDFIHTQLMSSCLVEGQSRKLLNPSKLVKMVIAFLELLARSQRFMQDH